MKSFKISPEKNSNRLDVLEAKLDIVLMLTGGQFFGFIALIITLILS